MRRHLAPDLTRRDLLGWRVERLTTAGFETAVAERIAAEAKYDLHALLELVDRGCPPDLAARILAPLDHSDQRC